MSSFAICTFYLILGLLLLDSCKSIKRYENYQLLSLKIENDSQANILNKLQNRYPNGIDFGDGVAKVGSNVEVLVAPFIQNIFWKTVIRSDIEIDVLHYDIQKFYDKEFERLNNKVAYDPDDYNTYEQMQQELVRLVSACPEGFTCEIETIGLSTFGNEINVLKISQPLQSKEVIWIDSLIHAREWIAGTSIMKTAGQLVDNYDSDDDSAYLLNNYDFVILPVFNPDGYIYTWESDRMWRKNRNTLEGSECIGVDLNRNHRHHWGELPGADPNPCGETYMGPSAASEVEIQIVEAAVERLASERSVAMLMSVHTWAMAWLMPYGYQIDGECAITPDNDDLLRVSEAAVAAVEEAGGDPWVPGPTCAALYPATGITPDFAYGVAGIKYAFTPELRGPGFAPEKEVIPQAFNEWFAGMVAAVKERELIENNKGN